ncbi:hypothetical protein HZC53_01505 [Candidatus Uhrbacteria bacterium]|nr:hypothetical protein [Candidatus Uhrbacteria bacterium]
MAITVSPVKYEFDLKPGSAKYGQVTLFNETSVKQSYYPTSLNFSADGESGRQKFSDAKDVTGLNKWFSFGIEPITLGPGEYTEFDWSINVPESAESGGYSAVLLFSNLPADAGAGSVGVGGRIGVIFLVNVTGDAKEGAEIESFKVIPEGDSLFRSTEVMTDKLPVDIELRVKNTGGLHIVPKCEIKVTDIFGRESFLDVFPADGTILPGTIRRFHSRFGSKSATDGDFLYNLRNEWMEFTVGRYRAKATVSYGSENQSIVAVSTFWILPWRTGLCLGIISVLLVLVINGYNRKTVSAARKKTGES